MSVALLRHVNGLISDFAGDYGELDLIGRRIDCSMETYETVLETFDAFGVVGGAGVQLSDGDEILLVRYEGAGGWADPGDSRRPGESYAECATRAVRESTGVRAAIDGLAQMHLLYLDDPTDREPIPNPYVAFSGAYESGTLRPGDGVTSVTWADSPPERLLYDELAEHPLFG